MQHPNSPFTWAHICARRAVAVALAFALPTLASPTPAVWAAPSAASTVSRLKSMLGRAVKEFNKIEERLPQQMIPVHVNAIERSFESLTKILAEMDEKLATVPEGEPGRDEAASGLAAAKSRRDELQKRFDAAQIGRAHV